MKVIDCFWRLFDNKEYNKPCVTRDSINKLSLDPWGILNIRFGSAAEPVWLRCWAGLIRLGCWVGLIWISPILGLDLINLWSDTRLGRISVLVCTQLGRVCFVNKF